MALDNETRKHILTTIDGMREDIVRFCSDLVKIPSVTATYMGVDVDEVLGGETRVSEFVALIFTARWVEEKPSVQSLLTERK